MPSRSLASRSADNLHPFVRIKAEAFAKSAMEMGYPILFTVTYRSGEEQNGLWLKGRDPRTGQIVDKSLVVTNAKAGESPHEFGLAFDCIPLHNGVPWWDAPQPVWVRLYKLAERVGLDALGDTWGEYVSWDKGHFQEPGWRFLRELLLGWKP